MKKRFIKNILAVILLCQSILLMANNIQVSNVTLTGKNTTNHYIAVQFSLTWENSWRTASAPFNYDAAWVFVKYRIRTQSGGDGIWKHCWLANTGHTAGTGTASTIEPGLQFPGAAYNAARNPALGAFYFRSAAGTGAYTITNAQLRWNYGDNGLTDNDAVEIMVEAIEMVYVPGGNFPVGDGSTTNVAGQFTAKNTTANYTITGDSVPSTLGGTTTGNLGNNNNFGMSTADDFNNTTTKKLPTAFPKGYKSFYCMKYEISQQGYVDFLNTLTETQLNARMFAKPAVNNRRYNITGSVVDSITTSTPYVACNFLGWDDVAAYLDWSGLRPMTELEYEKSCRGSVAATANEYAWGSTAITQATGITNPGQINEKSTNNGNCAFGSHASVQGPMRVGAFAGAATTRVQSGSSYYGIMDLSGNLWERAITIGNTAGRSFTGLHGNGLLTAAGLADVTNWPGSGGAGFRGGDFYSATTAARVSSRDVATFNDPARTAYYGGRGVRTHPLSVGDLYQGGMIAYLLQPADAGYDTIIQKGLVSSLGDQSGGAEWITGGNTQTTRNKNTVSAYGYGRANTNFMIAQTGFTGGAAKVCDDWINSETGTGVYSDWFLPSGEELVKLLNNKTQIGGFVNAYYWCSTENDATSAYMLSFQYGDWFWADKYDPRRVRAVRYFPTVPVVTTSALTSITSSTAIGGGNVVSPGEVPIIARGVCWSASTGPTIDLATKTSDAPGNGAFTSTLTNLSDTTLYYVIAYAISAVGTSYGPEVTFKTRYFYCGTTAVTVYHIADSVSPATGTLNYSTVTGIPGEELKCWTTKNLGATQQATSANDATAASAGWYWQFNRKRGYSYVTSISPAWTITTITENSDWLLKNDPCSIELGGIWRIPTRTEWNNVDSVSGWTENTAPYNSGLKLHNGGYLDDADGVLDARGIQGYFWSSTQDASKLYNGWMFDMETIKALVRSEPKADGYPIRCIRTWPYPTLTTAEVSSIGNSTAISGGNITLDGGSPITARGVCWSTDHGPTIALPSKTIESGTTGAFTSNLTNLTGSTLYYVRAYATNGSGTSYGNEVSFTTAYRPLAIGDLYKGGIVAYILLPGDTGYNDTVQHGLIVCIPDLGTSIPWIEGGNTQNTLNGNTSGLYGTGQANTNAMMAQPGFTGGAAKVCNDYINIQTGTGVYSDWFLPSAEELDKLYTMYLLGFGGFAAEHYWSSTEFSWRGSVLKYFLNGVGSVWSKPALYYVRAVRTF